MVKINFLKFLKLTLSNTFLTTVKVFVLFLNISSLEAGSKESVTTTKTMSVEQFNSLYHLSKGLLDAGYYKHALNYASQIHKQSVIQNNLSILLKVAVANNLAVVKSRLGEYGESRQLLQSLVAVIKSHRKSNSLIMQNRLSILHTNLFELHLLTRDYVQAQHHLSESVKIKSKIYSRQHPVLIHQNFMRIHLEFDKGNYRYAKQLLTKHWSQLPGGRLFNEARAESRLLAARINMSDGDVRKASANLYRALKWQGTVDSELTAAIYRQMSYLKHYKSTKVNNNNQALIYHRKYISMLQRLYGAGHPRIAQAIIDFANHTQYLSLSDRALVLKIYTQCYGPNHPRTLKVARQLYKKTGDSQVAL